MRHPTVIALSFALLASLCWSGNFVAARGVHEWIPPFTLAFWRWVVALTVVTPIAWPHFRKQWRLVAAHWKYVAMMGIASVGIYNTLIYLASHHTTTHHIALISSTAPIWTLLLAGLFGTERLSRYKLGGAALAFAGALMILTHGELGRMLEMDWNRGDLILLTAAWVWAFYSVMLHYKPKEMHTLTFLISIFAVGLCCLLPLYLWESQTEITPFTLQAWGVYAYVGIFASVVAWFAWNNAVQLIGSVKASLVYYSIPVFSSVIAVYWLDEPLALYHLAGFVLIVMGIITSNLRKLGIAKE